MTRHAGAIGFAALTLAAVACGRMMPSGAPENGPTPTRQDRYVMGTMAQVEVYAGEARGIEEAFRVLKQHEDELHIGRRGETPLRNQAREMAERFRAKTSGTLDARMAHLVRLWGWHGDAPRIPTERELAEALPRARPSPFEGTDGWDFGAIGKGLAAAAAARALGASGATSALVNLGGNIQTLGAPPGGDSWSIAVRHPRDPEGVLGVIGLPGGWAAATSGDYERFLVARSGRRLHHILDPVTGRPAERGAQGGRIVAVTVIAPDAGTADAWSTAAFVLGPVEGFEAVEREPDLEAVFTVEEPGGRLRTWATRNLAWEPAER